MTHYKQLTRKQRYQISSLKKTAGLNQSRIADEVGVNKSTISREFRRNKELRDWHPKQVQDYGTSAESNAPTPIVYHCRTGRKSSDWFGWA